MPSGLVFSVSAQPSPTCEVKISGGSTNMFPGQFVSLDTLVSGAQRSMILGHWKALL